MIKKGIFSSLQIFFDLYKNSSLAIKQDSCFLEKICGVNSSKAIIRSIGHLREIYERSVVVVENDAANSGFSADLLQLQRNLYTELEHLLSLGKKDRRHQLLIVIPVADRPAMLKNCLASVAEQCRLFQYGGSAHNAFGLVVYNKVKVFIIDDSRDNNNRNKIRELASEANSEGVETRYIGLLEQTGFLKQLPEAFKERTSMLLGSPDDRFLPHKGSSVTRNIAYLYLHSLLRELHDNTLFYFIDSDEEFSINTQDDAGTGQIPFINYFYWIDRIFSSGKVEVLTGKVVGDPPVSPSVMINTFLADLIAFFENISVSDIHANCCFHVLRSSQEFSAEYHDMGTLFGYKETGQSRTYQCSLVYPHDLLDCFRDFSERALGFFYGQHPTRGQFYNHTGAFTMTEPARTVYTGNYVFNEKGFRNFIPFASLKFRMAGPAFGRILRGKIGDRFISANLPLLHKRTISGQHRNEYRTGLVENHNTYTLDLSDEFYRQFWGDVMLFSVDSLAVSGYPAELLDRREIIAAVRRVQDNIWSLFLDKQTAAAAKIARLSDYLSAPAFWWNRYSETKKAVNNFRQFCYLSEQNFGVNSLSMQNISGQIREGVHAEMITDAIHAFYDDESCWNELLKATSTVVFSKTSDKS